jgi:hypothetical protein
METMFRFCITVTLFHIVQEGTLLYISQDVIIINISKSDDNPTSMSEVRMAIMPLLLIADVKYGCGTVCTVTMITHNLMKIRHLIHHYWHVTHTYRHTFNFTSLIKQDWKDVIHIRAHTVSTSILCTVTFWMPLTVPRSFHQDVNNTR